MRPQVTVLIPTYNRLNYLPLAVSSALAQRFDAFEVLVVDDGSTDATAHWLSRVRDPRLRVVSNPGNLGIAAAHRLGLAEARGEYLAFLDSDEWALPQRLALQVAWLEAHPRVAALGSAYQPVDAAGKPLGHARRNPGSPAHTAAGLLFHCAVHKPTVTARVTALRRYGFSAQYRYFDDYDLWARMAGAGGAPANLPQVLGTYRKHPAQTTLGQAQALAETRQICARALDALGVRYTDAELTWHVLLAAESLGAAALYADPAFLEFAQGWLNRLLTANRRAGIYHPVALRAAVAQRWFRLWQRGARDGGPGVLEGVRRWPSLVGPMARAAVHWRLGKRLRPQVLAPPVVEPPVVEAPVEVGGLEVPVSSSR